MSYISKCFFCLKCSSKSHYFSSAISLQDNCGGQIFLDISAIRLNPLLCFLAKSQTLFYLCKRIKVLVWRSTSRTMWVVEWLLYMTIYCYIWQEIFCLLVLSVSFSKDFCLCIMCVCVCVCLSHFPFSISMCV